MIDGGKQKDRIANPMDMVGLREEIVCRGKSIHTKLILYGETNESKYLSSR